MILLFFVNYLDRVNVGVAALRMNADLGFSTTVFGLGAGLLFVGYIVFELPSNLVLRKVGARRWIAVITASWGVCAAATAFVSDETTFYVLRFLLGACEAGFLPGMVFYLTEWFPRQRRGRSTALFMLAVPLTVALGTPLSTLLMSVESADFEGWRFMFFAEGAPAVLLSVLVLRLLPDRPEDARWLAEHEKVALRAVLTAERDSVAKVGSASLRAALRDVRVYAIGMIGFGISGGLYALTFFLPQIVAGFRNSYGVTLSTYEIGLVTAFPSALAAVSMWWYARRSDRVGERIRHIALPLFPAAIALGVALYLRSPVLVMLAITVTTVGAFIVLPVWWQLPGMFLTGPAAAGGIGVIAALGNSSGFVAPYLTGWMRDLTGDYRTGMLVIAGFMIAAALGTLALARDSTFGNSFS
ncbi:nitrate/nitrite transporter NarK [Herbihabitans rhizosphaerae]|uniref:Nitrate/nitrite transporter NarK n=1 Tax=Herbihabitans rhizosphaerae TaxID=1872711 RepID=A0A4Q7KIL4_9PSEU|nr:MFS transporter [Herbihabitans rhizosphaerae]RZS36379.1 nitrate/nitrite transporter NarK [Herbihabitans rhizosphaerae]